MSWTELLRRRCVQSVVDWNAFCNSMFCTLFPLPCMVLLGSRCPFVVGLLCSGVLCRECSVVALTTADHLKRAASLSAHNARVRIQRAAKLGPECCI